MRTTREPVVSPTNLARAVFVGPPAFIAVLLVLTFVASACALGGADGGIDESRPERFRFEMRVPDEAEEEIASRLLAESRRDNVLIAETIEVEAVGPGTPIRYFVQFEMIDRELGRMTCFGEVTERVSSTSCSPIGDPIGDPQRGILRRGGGGSETWSEATFQVRNPADRLVATADDGTRYVMIPANDVAWIEWRSAHGDLLVEAFDADGAVIATEVARRAGVP